ncbi:MAG TPA: electron transfer flavoprotein subunit alpha/FixB family protein [Clostridia bacterium]|nr:electron transfer flavoprotein subunit alpha/FixB family protein [Clostridia bacterium]
MAETAVLALLQQAEGILHPDSYGVASAARTLAAQCDGDAVGVSLVDNMIMGETFTAQLKSTGLCRVYVIADRRFAAFIAEEHCAALVKLIRDLNPDIFLAPATPEGRALSSMAAAALHTGVTADCTALRLRADGLLLQTRPAFGGNVMAEIVTPKTRPQVATIRCGVASPSGGADTQIVLIGPGWVPARAREVSAEWVERVPPVGRNEDVVLALGGGVAAREDIALFRDIAERVGASLMCSRALVERGWFPRGAQIGLSGRRVDAGLLITLGVSGSAQFMAGAQGAKKLIAVNPDENAPIMRAADVPIIGNMYEIAHELDALVGAKQLH